MHGKATLILTDKDTGRVVEQIEEHNMVTNALNSIFSLPQIGAFYSSSRKVFNGYLPMYSNILKGLVLFDETIPENANDYMLGGKYSVLATAGDEYSGTDTMRGTFNASQSCEIENGYRFVWDFAPEKAVGTIKALSLTHRYLGNRGNLTLSGASSYYMVHSSDISNSSGNDSVSILSGAGRVFLQKGKGTFYSYSTATNAIKIMKYRIPNPLALKICDKTSGVLENETTISLAFSPTSTITSYDPITQRLYAFYSTYQTVDGVRYLRLRYAKINPETFEKESETEYFTTGVPYTSSAKIAVYDGKLYISASDLSIYICSLEGVVEKTINLGLYSLSSFLTIENKFAIECKLTSSGRTCIYILDEPKTQLTQYESSYIPIATNEVTLPYCLAYINTAVFLMFRTDYLATINNLATPLEKTDQHALQVRYEITY